MSLFVHNIISSLLFLLMLIYSLKQPRQLSLVLRKKALTEGYDDKSTSGEEEFLSVLC